jgi:hypothetical protein
VHVPENGGSNPPHGTKKSQRKFEKNLENWKTFRIFDI